jgi:probable rRNA maturation factor
MANPGKPPRTFALANRHPRLRFPRAEVMRMFAVLEANASAIRLPQSAFLTGELSLVFLTDTALARLHADFMDDPMPTDVITFEGVAAELAGEICVSADMAARAARERRTDFATELTLYLVHGWLHLAGYDDLQPVRKRLMRAAERRALAQLRRHDAIPAFRLAPRRTPAR